ncbi:hypothetical protein P5673_001986 [Acropora cervicornis]|uniref:Uncharacterized protein n=1 Tax=Acropora cervicornis TaxID=6130 RepID=A0AAD9R4L5_ACRCE|nr:hypothetical protein P5673_001986 [Acropora cervicornis]
MSTVKYGRNRCLQLASPLQFKLKRLSRPTDIISKKLISDIISKKLICGGFAICSTGYTATFDTTTN